MQDRELAPGREGPRDGGFTLTEVLVAMVLFGILLASSFGALTATLGHVRNVQDRTLAANLAARVIERLHAAPADQLPVGSLPDQVVSIANGTFTVRSRIALTAGSGSSGSSCNASGALSAVAIHVEVSWAGMDVAKPVVSDTLRQLTVTDLDLTHGSLDVVVQDSNGDGVAGQQVTATPGTWTATTDSTGCATFDGLPSGSYTVALAARSGWADPSGDPAPAHSTSITGGSLTQDAGFAFDRTGTLVASWSSPSSVPVLPGTGLTVQDSASSSVPQVFSSCSSGTQCAAATAAGVTVSGLWPSAQGLRAWAGTCADARPSTLAAAVPLPRGASAAVTVPLAEVTLTVKNAAGKVAKGQSVVVSHSASGCASATSQTVTEAPTASTIAVGVPGGTWSFSSGAGTPVTVVLTPGQKTNVTVAQL